VAEAPCWLTLPRETRRLGVTLLDQQLWCWGQDVRCQPNLLVAHGFDKAPPPPGTPGPSAYHLTLDEGRWVTLWAFGIGYGDPAYGGLFLARYGFAPRLLPDGTPPRQVWKQAQLGARLAGTEAACAAKRQLLAGALTWVAGYERWVRVQGHEDHRQASVERWWKRQIPAAEMIEQWLTLAEQCRELPLRDTQGRRSAS
jgi:hypothetical protein